MWSSEREQTMPAFHRDVDRVPSRVVACGAGKHQKLSVKRLRRNVINAELLLATPRIPQEVGLVEDRSTGRTCVLLCLAADDASKRVRT
jgi:hypothetical protein